MILTNEIEIKINTKNIKHYKDLGYECELKDIIIVKSIDIIKGSHKIVDVKCEICNSESKLKIVKYWENREKYNFYSCKKCSGEKRKMTNLDKYGVEYISQTKGNRERMKKFMSSDEFKDKSKETMIGKYGVDRYCKSDEFKKIMYENKDVRISKIMKSNKKTCLERYGVENYMLTGEFREKAKETMIEKYGAPYSMQNEYIMNKSKETLFENYGVYYAFNSDEIMNKIKETNIKKYGSDNPFSNKDIQNKIRKTKINMGLQSEDIKDYEKYKNKCLHLTRKNKIELFENWDGYDYYDNEYIKNFISEGHLSKNYPTIDHKISVLYGYLNNIPVEEISHIYNLCITKRSINSKKGEKCEKEFKNNF